MAQKTCMFIKSTFYKAKLVGQTYLKNPHLLPDGGSEEIVGPEEKGKKLLISLTVAQKICFNLLSNHIYRPDWFIIPHFVASDKMFKNPNLLT